MLKRNRSRTNVADHASQRAIWRYWPWAGLVVVALGVIVGFLGYTPGMWGQDALLVLLAASVFALRHDAFSAVLLVVFSQVIDWYQLLPTPHTIYMTALMGGVALLALIFIAERKNTPWRALRPVDFVLWGLFLLLGIAAIPRGYAIPIAPKLLLITSTLYVLYIFVSAFVFWLLGTVIAREPTHLRQLFSLLAAFGAILGIHASLQEVGIFLLLTPQMAHFLAQPGINHFALAGSHAVRATSFFLGPDVAESFFSSVALLPLGLLVSSRTWAARALYGAELLATLAGLLFTFGPVGWGVFAICLAIFVPFGLRGRARAYCLGVLGVAVVGGVVLLPHIVSKILSKALSPHELGLRVEIWHTSLNAISAHPLLGLGLGEGTVWQDRIAPYLVPGLANHYSHSQNSFLELAAMAGIPVLIAVLALLVTGLYRAIQNYRLADWTMRPIILSGMLTILALCLNGTSDATWTANNIVPLGWLILGALASPWLTASLKRAETAPERAFYPVRYGPASSPMSSLTSAPTSAPTAGVSSTDPRRAFPLDLASTTPLPIGAISHGAHGDDGHGMAAIATAREALCAWNEYVRTGETTRAERVIDAAKALADTQIALPGDGGGWLVTGASSPGAASGEWLSAGVQALALATLTRGYALSGDLRLRDAAERARIPFQRDILDGGVIAPAGDRGVVFQGVAVYPASHMLGDALLGLICLSEDEGAASPHGAETLRDAHETLHSLLPEYDRGVTIRPDLARGTIPSTEAHVSHAALLAAFADIMGCPVCAARAEAWRAAAASPSARLAVSMMRMRARVAAVPRAVVGGLVFPQRGGASNTDERPARVCIPITAYPVAGGMRAVLGGWREAMDGLWQMEFLTRHIGPGGEGQIIRSFEVKVRPFGRQTSTPSQFPNVWFYVYAGWQGLRRTLRRFPGYTCILPQDGIWTAAFAAVAGRLAGVRVVTVDHGNIFALYDSGYRQERAQFEQHHAPFNRMLKRARLVLYWPSLRFLARAGTRYSTAFLTASDDMSDIYREQFGVPAYRISRFPFMVDTARYSPTTSHERTALRARYTIADDATVIAMVNRLSPEKGLDVALTSVQRMLASLPEDLRSRVRVLIAGDGPLRARVEREIGERGLRATVRLLGEASPGEVIDVLRASDLFLFTATRSINSMAVLEAMATGCAVVATASTRHISEYLADGGGLTVPVRDVDGLANALLAYITDEERLQRARAQARAYVSQHHTAENVRRVLLRATGYLPTYDSVPAREPVQPSYSSR